MTVSSGLVRRRLAGAFAAALLLLAGCADATGLVGSTTDGPTDEPTEERTDEPTTEPTEEPTAEPVEAARRPRRGDCIPLTSSDVFYDVLRDIPESEPCSRRHAGQITDVQPLTPAMRRAVRTATFGPVTDRLQRQCRERTRTWLGTDEEGLVISQFFSLPALPSYADSLAGADWFACTTYAIQRGTRLLALPRDTRGLLADGTDSPYGTCAQAAIRNEGDDRMVCSIRHNWRAVAAVRLGGPGAPFDGENRVRERVRRSCETPVRTYLDTTGAYAYGYTWPTRSLWRDGDRYGVCYARVDV